MLTETPLVSVVLCFYNEEEFIQEAIESVFSQSYKNWELILVDDGSSDASTHIAKRFAEDNPGKISYIEHENHLNRGLSASRNAGIDKATGNYVALLDADDIWCSEKLDSQLKQFKKFPNATVIFESSLYWHSWKNKSQKDVLVQIGVKPDRVYYPPQLMLELYPLGAGAAPCPSGIIIKRQVFETSKFEDSFQGIYQMYEDQAFLCKLYLREAILISGICNNLYRQRGSSIVSKVHQAGKYDLVRKYYLEWFEKFYRGQEKSYSSIDKSLGAAFFKYRNPVRYWCTVTFPSHIKHIIVRSLIKLKIIHYRN